MAPAKVCAAKQRALFEATLNLLKEGYAPHQLKISQIAQKAGIGKGTVYEYFESKQALFSGVVEYCRQRELSQLEEILQNSPTFFGAVRSVAVYMRDCAQNPLSSFRLLAAQKLAGEEWGKIPTRAGCCTQSDRIRVLVAKLLEKGRKEGAIGPSMADNTACLALLGAFAAFSLPGQRLQQEEQILDQMQLLLKKALA